MSQRSRFGTDYRASHYNKRQTTAVMIRRACTHILHLHIKPIISMLRLFLPFFCLFLLSVFLTCLAAAASATDQLCNTKSSSGNLNHNNSQPGVMKRYVKRGNIARLCTRIQPKDDNLDVILSCFEVQLV